MSSISSEKPHLPEKGKKNVLSESAKRSLRREEEAVHEAAAKQALVKSAATETQAIVVHKEITAPKPEEKFLAEHLEMVSKAVEGVTGVVEGKTTPLSIHDKWASLQFKEVLKNEGEDKIVQRIADARAHIQEIKEMYQSLQAGKPPSSMHAEVMELLKTGSMTRVEAGKGGVYFLLDRENNPKFVIKPGDETILAINNGKHFASPFLDRENFCFPKEGVHIYEAEQNAELSYLAAELLGFEEITPKTEVMVIDHPVFHDILDGTTEKNDPQIKKMERRIPPSKKKLCTVQRFVENSWDIGDLLCSQSTLDPEEIKRLMREEPEEYEKLQQEYTPQNINHSQYEKIMIFSFLIGEKDGNAGNFMCSKAPVEEGESLSLHKIDNVATFPDCNDDLNSGLEWVVYNYVQELSPQVKELIQNIDNKKVDSLKRLMKERRKTEASMQALDDRIKYLKKYAQISKTIEELDLSLTNHNW